MKEISNEKYQAHEALGSSSLAYGLVSMAKFHAYMTGQIKKSDEDKFKLGTAVHSAILEQTLSGFVSDGFMVAQAVGEYSRRTGKISKSPRSTTEYKNLKLEAEEKGQKVLTQDQYDSVQGMYDTFIKNELANKMVSKGKPELSFFTTIEGIEVKARPDFLQEECDGFYIMDYKSTAQGSDFDSFQKKIFAMNYDTQAAHYINVVSKSLGKPCKGFFWIVQETEAPYELGFFKAEDYLLNRAHKRLESLYKEIAKCREVDEWPGRKSEIFNIDLRDWDAEQRSK